MAAQNILEYCSKSNNIKTCGLQPLHKAVLQGDKEKIQKCVRRGDKIDRAARRRWTPAHFAAMRSTREILELLYELGASKSVLNSHNGTPENIWELTHLKSGLRVNLWNEETNKVDSIDADEFTRVTKARFVESIKMSPLKMAELWMNGYSGEAEIRPNMPLYHKIQESAEALQTQSSVYLKKMEKQVGYGINSLKNFEAGEIIGEYQGEFLGVVKPEDSEYSTQNIDGAHLRGYIAFSAHGMPNAILFDLKDYRGLPIGEFLVALRKIEAHESITWGYGAHDVVWEVYHELKPDQLDEFLKVHGFNYPVREPSTVAEHEPLFVLNYILTTPTVFWRLLFENKFSSKDLEIISEKAKYFGKHFQNSIEVALTFEQKLWWFQKESVHSFLAQKAREGNMQIMYGFMEHFDSFKEPQTLWDDYWVSFCKQSLETGILHRHPHRGDCARLTQILAKKAQDEL